MLVILGLCRHNKSTIRSIIKLSKIICSTYLHTCIMYLNPSVGVNKKNINRWNMGEGGGEAVDHEIDL